MIKLIEMRIPKQPILKQMGSLDEDVKVNNTKPW